MPKRCSKTTCLQTVVAQLCRIALTALSLIALTACSNLNSESRTALEQPPKPEVPVEELIVEGLVSEANQLGDINIDNKQDIPLDDSDEEPVESIVSPVEPTINMTANRVVERAINDYLQNRQTQLKIWIERSQTWFPMIEQVFAEEGIPDELKYLALGESGLRPTVRSGAGAVGMWQFMYGTARSAGLEINTWVDERRDPEKSTRAAALHIKELYESYSGNWELVLAGYNCSYRCITRAARRAGKTLEDKPSYWEIYPYLPRETRGFVPKFIAAALIVSNPEMYGIFTENFGQEIAYDIVEVSGMLALEDAARLAGTDMGTIRALNPALIKATLPDRLQPYPLNIPLGTYERFVRAFNNMPAAEKTAPSEYTIVRGDTLDRIARSYKTSVEELQAVNGIRGHLIHPGQKLLIPGTGVSTNISIASVQRRFVEYGEHQFKPIKLGDDFQLVELKGSTVEKPLVAVALSPDVEEDMLVPTVYKVRSGDTLGQIAQRFNVSVRDIQAWNSIRGTTIFTNQDLTIHSGVSAPIRTYQVQSGDNLSIIARRFGVSVENLKRWNNLDSNMIHPGQMLTLN